jgi:dihydroorotate dehydrogenase (NAD+) catalytic subunit
VEFLLAGAQMISLGTANFVNPQAPLDVLRGLEAYCERQGFMAVRELSGRAHERKDGV